MANSKPNTSVAALSVQFRTADQALQLLPAGEFRSTDGSGRPADAPYWKLDSETAPRLIARMAAKANPLVIDYEHQTLQSEKNGQPAPAAGWFAGSALEWREGEGLFALAPAWTKRAAAMIADEEYKFISPVFEYDRATGAVLDIRMAALTNNAGLTGMAAVALTALNDLPVVPPTKEASMPELLKKLLAALGLPDTASESDALAAIDSMKKAGDTVAACTAEIAALKAANPDPSKYAPVETMQQLQTQLAALTADLTTGKVNKIVADALAVGKLLPAQEEWAKDLGKSNLAALTAYVEKTPAIAALGGMQSGESDPAGAGKGVAALSAEQKQVAAALGLSVEQFNNAALEA